MWSGLSAMAHSRVSFQLSSDWPGMENMRSMLISGMPACLRSGTVSCASDLVCSRPSVFRTLLSNDWIPSEMRVMPSCLKNCAFLRSNVAGFASKVNSLIPERSKCLLSWLFSSERCVGESMDGVPPPR